MEAMTPGTAVTPAMISNLFTMGCTAKVDPRQAIPEVPYTAPPLDVRALRARLLLEEVLETIRGLGFNVIASPSGDPRALALEAIADHDADSWESIEAVIDGCVDTNYVATGTLAAYSVPDLPHIMEVNRANNDKFPGGVAVLREDGKFQKPEGWRGPDHAKVRHTMDGYVKKWGLDGRWNSRSLLALQTKLMEPEPV